MLRSFKLEEDYASVLCGVHDRYQHSRGQANLMAHGGQEIPVWGPVFWRMSQGREEQAQMRITNLNRYLESLLEK
jgi:hypothetical protein